MTPVDYAEWSIREYQTDLSMPLFARQPIFDANLNVVAHELLFRGEITTGEQATAEVLLSAFDQSMFDAGSASLPVFVNFPESILMQMPTLDKSRLVVEVLEDVDVTASLVAQLQKLHEQGYRIALDDYVHTPEFAPLLDFADIIKLDVLSMEPQALDQLARELRQPGRQLLAEKVESHAMYQQCLDLGMDYFQGFFFAKPDIVHGHTVNANAVTVLNLLAALQQPDMTFERLEQIVLSDTVLTYRIIKLVNSAGYRRAKAITSVAGAISMLGFRQISAFASLVSLSQVEEKPKALGEYTAVRAFLCQNLGALANLPYTPESLFTLGLLSCVDAFFDQSIEQLAGHLPVADELKEALVSRNGLLGYLLNLVQQYQEGTWQNIDQSQLSALNLSLSECDAAYAECQQWLRYYRGALFDPY